ncbi:2-deoxy-D-gluconate 3-dehydrogenase [Nocardioides gansuensis]|uniref:2-deoxy-D-gluconate 3-dehydrogenase n=1 Tax=Nocardioides gansuensis TaxID=2138300 RepID=A0A2T8FDN3_9ACTN|nr:SDR family oxidoreductase [Nocardioides gansuensis]PVG83815.1 2-deoxy-D-gluconate 3-dehydrogenase [Nocardioides gansuensis]
MTWLEQRFGLAGCTALVTGARTGIGRASALALAEAGADLVLWGRDAADLEDVATEARALGRRVRTVGADLSDPSAIEDTAADVLTETEVDVLVNNAGTIRRADAAETTFEDWRAVLSTNLDSAFLLARAFGAPMVERGSGAIVNIASLLSFQGGIRVPAYAASKHAVAGLTKALANEWAASGVTVNAVAPGYVVTGNTEALRADPEREPAIRSRIPAGRWAEVEDIVGAVVFLASPAAAYVNGHVLVVDGGWLAR